MKKISAVLITFNEEQKLRAALSSLSEVCDELVVVDSGSTDRTRDICEEFGCRFLVQPWLGFAKQKQFATEQARCEWVLNLDADEQLSRELVTELLAWKASEEEAFVAFKIPRLTHFMGQWIRHTTWYPDWSLRLYRKDCGQWTGGRVHEGFHPVGQVGSLSKPLLHFTYSGISEYLVQLEKFSTLAAADLYDAGRRVGGLKIAIQPPATFLKNYVIKRGFLDGLPGFVVSFLAMVSTFFKLVKLWELQSGRKIWPAEWGQFVTKAGKGGSVE